MRDKKVFKVKKVTKLQDIVEQFESGSEVTIGQSDLSLQDDTHLIQFDLEGDSKKREKYEIKPGTYNIAASQAGLYLTDLEFRTVPILKTNNHAEEILSEVTKFFSNLDTYTKYGIEPKRALLMYGPPGCGKTTAITEACNNLIKEDEGTVVINWNASTIRSGDVLDFFTSGSKYSGECSKVVIIIEDIGMSVEGYSGAKEVDRSLLNFLDGSGVSFKLPTFIMSTTNYAHNLPENLINRPKRFDKVMEVGPPSADIRVELIEFVMKEKLSEEDKKIIRSRDCDNFSAAHLSEIFIRSKLDNSSIAQVVRELKEHNKRVKNAFSNNGGSLGLM